MAMSHINRFSHIVMDGSPVNSFGLRKIKEVSLRMFGNELKSTKQTPVLPDRTSDLLPPAPLPRDMTRAKGNPRIARAISRWAGAIEREAPKAVPREIMEFVKTNLSRWDGYAMPLSRSWVENETEALSGHDRDLARFALIVAKSSTQMEEELIGKVLKSEEQFIRTLAWASFYGARRVTAVIASQTGAVTSEESVGSELSAEREVQRA